MRALKKALAYDPETGVFRWLISPTRSVKVGDTAGGLNREGYLMIRFKNRKYAAHRLAWWWVTGKWPKEHIDHRNGVKDDNRFCNLREATLAENNQNRTAPNEGNTSGLLGVSWESTSRRWRAQIWVNGASRTIGRFKEKEEARAAYTEAKEQLHLFFATRHTEGT